VQRDAAQWPGECTSRSVELLKNGIFCAMNLGGSHTPFNVK
jgi:hypothetical protein